MATICHFEIFSLPLLTPRNDALTCKVNSPSFLPKSTTKKHAVVYFNAPTISQWSKIYEVVSILKFTISKPCDTCFQKISCTNFLRVIYPAVDDISLTTLKFKMAKCQNKNSYVVASRIDIKKNCFVI